MANEKSVSLMETTLSNTLGSQRTPGSRKSPSAARVDAGLVRAIAVDRNRDAFAELFDRYAPRVRFFAMKMGADGALLMRLFKKLCWRFGERRILLIHPRLVSRLGYIQWLGTRE